MLHDSCGASLLEVAHHKREVDMCGLAHARTCNEYVACHCYVWPPIFLSINQRCVAGKVNRILSSPNRKREV